jgi:hypothetical protein
MNWVDHVAGMGETRNAYKILIDKAEGKVPLALHRCRSKLENITKMGLKEIRYEDAECEVL